MVSGHTINNGMPRSNNMTRYEFTARFLVARLKFLFFRTSPVATRFALAAGALLWSLMLFWPGDTFSRPTYTLMAQFASEYTWAMAFGLQGAYSMYSILMDRCTKTAFLIEGVFGCVLWSGSCICMMLSIFPVPAAISGEIVAAVASWWHLVRFQFTTKR